MDLPGSLAPIVLFCYNRPGHLQQTIESLQNNLLASQSDLFIFSDGPKNKEDVLAIQAIRERLSKLTGFRNITIHSAETNKGLAKSVIEGVSTILDRYGKIIVLEDDMLSAPDFLTFMNNALDQLKSRPDIFSVSGYTPPISIPDHYKEDTYIAPRASSWGWGTWAEKWRLADWNVTDFEQIKNDPAQKEKLTAGGDDLWPMLYKQQNGVIDSWAIRWTYTQFINDAYGLYPVRSKIKNIGTDGTGTNFTFKSGYYGKEMEEGALSINPDLQPDAEVIRAFHDYYNMPLKVKIKNWIKYRI